MASPTMSDFDVDEFLTNVYPNVGVGGATGSLSDLLTSPVGVGSAPPPMTVTPLRSVGAVGVGTTRPPLCAPPTLSAGKQPRRHVAYKRMPRGRRRRPPASATRRVVAGGTSDDDDSDVSSASSTSTNPGGRHRMSQQELRRQLELLSNDQVQTASGRRIAGITTTNTITTTYKDGGRPQVARHSSRVSH